ncbi:MAG: alpha/beta hydrolase [Dethiosulfatibacter sp.]|nr:alpha/beta hydrolase [Dethiosulfatibacter sp.]
MTIYLALLVVMFLVLSIISWRFSGYVITPESRDIDTMFSDEEAKGNISIEYFDTISKTDFNIKTDDGLNLSGQWLYPENPTNKVVILCHGFGVNRVGSIKYITPYLNRGYQVIIYDNRNAGNSDKRYTTMGFAEKNDLKNVLDYVYGIIGPQCFAGTHGESMGGATVLLHACMDSRVRFVVADCPYADLSQQLKYRLKVEQHLPPFPLIYLTSLVTKIRAGFFFGDVSPEKEIIKQSGLSSIPIMFAHGKEDRYILPESSIKLFDIKKGYKLLYIADHAKHAESIWVDPEHYNRQVNILLDVAELHTEPNR